MNRNIIEITDAGVAIGGVVIGTTPKASELETSLPGKVRSTPPLNGRILKVNDATGLSWLIELSRGTVLWLRICLAPPEHRRISDKDPSSCFQGKLRIGQHTVQGPFPFETAEIIRKVKIRNVGLDLIPGRKTINAVLVAFTESEKESDAERN